MIVKGYKFNSDYRQKSDFWLYKNLHLTQKEVKNTIWKNPSLVTNILITEKGFLENKDLFFDAIEELGCKHLAWTVSQDISMDEVSCFAELIKNGNTNSVQLYLKFKEFYYSDLFGELIIPNKIIKKAIIYCSPFNKNYENKILFLTDEITVSYSKNRTDFRVNIELFRESQAHHTYFNRKLYIGPNGEIKNAPECEETFGYIQDLESPEQLKEIVQTPAFQKYWYVHKEITDVCKDCEFRHMCVDNRLPYQRAENEWYHKQECNYNPYIAKWKDEEGYRTLEECGVISNENGFSIDHDKIAKINEELWGEE